MTNSNGDSKFPPRRPGVVVNKLIKNPRVGMTQAEYDRQMAHQYKLARYRRKMKDRQRSKERQEERKLKRAEAALTAKIRRAEAANSLAKRRMDEIAARPSQLGVNMLVSISKDKRLSAETRGRASTLLLSLAMGEPTKGQRHKSALKKVEK